MRTPWEERVFVIAEIGSNHDESLQRAKELVHASKEAGADAVKFQSFTAEGLFNPFKPDNGKWTPHPAYPVIEKLALPEEWHYELKEYADSLGITFLSMQVIFSVQSRQFHTIVWLIIFLTIVD